MNIRQSLILSLTVAAFAVPSISSAASDQATNDMSQGANTRAEVIHAVEIARQDGSLVSNVSRSDSILKSALGTEKTRAQVVGELKTARANGEFATNIENNYAMPEKFAGTSTTRMEVERELTVARAQGQFNSNISRN
jgi:hypothetical protein